MAAAMSQSRALAGSKAMTMVQRAPTVKQVSNGSKYFMRKKGSFMVEVNVAETETEDQAVKRYMRAVVQSGVLNKLRSLRTKETKIEAYQRRQAEKAQARKLGIEEPTWEELYGNGGGEEGHPFDDYFCKPGDDDDFMGQGAIGELPALDDMLGYTGGDLTDLSSSNINVTGGYINPPPPMEGNYAAAPGQQ